MRRSFREEVVAAFHFLFQDHMPLTAFSATVLFPIVVGVGGVLTQKSHSATLGVLAMLPALFALILVCAVARRVLLDARRGLDDSPSLKDGRELVLEGVFTFVDLMVFSAIFLGPGLLLMGLDVPVGGSLLVLALGALLLPAALMLRIVRCDWQALHPQLLFATIVKGGAPYLLTAGVIGALFLPGLLAGILTAHSQLYLTISVIGPLVVAPLFVAARLLGRLVDAHGDRLGAIVIDHAAPIEQRDPSIVSTVKLEKRVPTSAPAQPVRTHPTPRPATPVAKQPSKLSTPMPKPVVNPTPATKPTRVPPTVQPPKPVARPKPVPVRAAAGPAPAPARVSTNALPADLAGIPGLRVVSGLARTKAGASARTRR